MSGPLGTGPIATGAPVAGPAATAPPRTAPLLVVDAPWLLYRSFFALPESITGVDGHPVGALLGSVNALLRVIDRFRPRAVATCFGAEEAPYRVKLFPRYHAAREPMPEALRWQFEAAPELFAAFGWTVADAAPELEADDLLGAYAAAEATGATDAGTLLATGDRDLYQCVSAQISVLHLKGSESELVDLDGVRSRYGVEPAQVPDFIALRGDPSDGLPGAPGIGAKTAATLLAEHGSLEALLALGDGVLPPRVESALRENAALLRDFRAIATLRPIAVTRPTDATTDTAAGASAALALGMGQLARRLGANAS